MNNSSDNQDNIYLTSTNVNTNHNTNISILNEKFSNEFYIKSNKKRNPLILPSISRNNLNRKNYSTLDIEDKPEISNLNSYFAPENYSEYNKSCNKYQRKLDPIIKDKINKR